MGMFLFPNNSFQAGTNHHPKGSVCPDLSATPAQHMLASLPRSLLACGGFVSFSQKELHQICHTFFIDIPLALDMEGGRSAFRIFLEICLGAMGLARVLQLRGGR